MLTNWKAEDIVAVGEFEAVAMEKRVIFGIVAVKKYVTSQCLEKLELCSPGETPST